VDAKLMQNAQELGKTPQEGCEGLEINKEDCWWCGVIVCGTVLVLLAS